jgi:uncharacterized protein YjbI with pentapeptide repeats
VLTGFNILEGLGIDDPDKSKWRDFVFLARGRDLRGAIFDLGNLERVDFTGANLEGASLNNTRLDRSSFDDTRLQGASLLGAQLQGASLVGAQLQGAKLASAQLQGALLEGAQLQDAWLSDAQLQDAWLSDAQLQGASLPYAQLQGALLDHAQLQGASLADAHLQGASLANADLEATSLAYGDLKGASLQLAHIEVTDLWRARLWRTNRSRSEDLPKLEELPKRPALVFSEESDWWPVQRDEIGRDRLWDDGAYQDLKKTMGSLSERGDDQALERIKSLDCTSPDTTLASCDPDPALERPPEAAAWRKALEDASVDRQAYAKALAKALRTLVCSGGDDALFILRGLFYTPVEEISRLRAAGSEAPALVDFIMSKDCSVSSLLTADDRAKLLGLKRRPIDLEEFYTSQGPAPWEAAYSP